MKKRFHALMLLLCLPFIAPAQEAPADSASQDAPRLPSFRVNFEGGYSYRTAAVSDDVDPVMKSYVEQLKYGYNIAFNASWFFGRKYGLCFHYSRFMTSKSKDGLAYVDTAGTPGIGSVEDNIVISMVSGGLADRTVYLNGRLVVIGNMVLGLATYVDDAKALSQPLKIEGSSVAFTGLLGLDCMISPSVALGADISYLLATASNLTVNGQSLSGTEEGLSRFDFNVGIKYYY